MTTWAPVSLDDKYTKTEGRAYITGMQALVVACLIRRRLDQAADQRTAGFISGYRGSPIATFDNDLWRAKAHLDASDIIFQPGINEDLAATAVWGSQQIHIDGRATHDGAFGMWYGKGAGLDRCGDVMRHAHGAGTTPLGGVLAVSGDDHTLKSSSQAYHCEPFFVDMLMPVLYPADIQEIVDYAVLGWELSRFSGGWVGFKVLAEGVNSTSSVQLDMNRHIFRNSPDDGISKDRYARWPDPWPDVERRIHEVKLPAALAFAKANEIDRTISKATTPQLGVVTTGKSYLDVIEALRLLKLTVQEAKTLGLSIYKIGMPWPLEPDGATSFVIAHPKILVVEEKRGLIESQLKDLAYHLPADRRPQIVGRKDESGAPLLPYVQEATPEQIAEIIADRIAAIRSNKHLTSHLDSLSGRHRDDAPIAVRTPYFCSGCPHNTSTKVPEGSRAIAGVGCHYMAVDMDRQTETFTQMGGEGSTWIGTAPFSEVDHVFVNVGEGTYYHSGYLSIRACHAANVNVTFKILFNDAVAMTGGQPVDGQLSVPQIAAQMRAEGIDRIEVVTDQMDRYEGAPSFPDGVRVRHRDELEAVQKELRDVKGVSILIYDQECATEKRRRRKRGQMKDPAKRIFINDLVCEGCGDCGVKSNCLSVIPKETEFGRKRQIDQSSCNKDYSCVKGFCPSFVVVEGGEFLKSPSHKLDIPADALPSPTRADIPQGDAINILVTGVGGSGVVTIGALMGMAAHIEGRGFAVHDRLGMAQKFGGVTSHIRIADSPDLIHAVRIPAGSADVVIGGDLHVTALPSTLDLVDKGFTRAILNSNQVVTGEVTRNLRFDFQNEALTRRIATAFERDLDLAPMTDIAVALTGDAIGANIAMMGYALQKGWLPFSLDSLEQAIELNGVAVSANKRALAIGRYCAVDLNAVMAALTGDDDPAPKALSAIDQLVSTRYEFLTDYQDEAYAQRYERLVQTARMSEVGVTGRAGGFTEAVARYFFKLMAYKDEYEVARLHTSSSVRMDIAKQFRGDFKMKLFMAPPLISKRDRETGELQKREFGPWIWFVMRQLAKLKILRGTPFDIFGYTEERKQERSLIETYEAQIAKISSSLRPETIDIAIAIASLPDDIRGYGHVKEKNMASARERQRELLDAFAAADTATPQAAE